MTQSTSRNDAAESCVIQIPDTEKHLRNSEGAFVDLTDGRILFVYSQFYGKGHGDQVQARLCSRVSADGGRTWSERDEVVVENEGRCNVMSVSLLRLQDGRIALFYLRKNQVDDCRAYLRTSQDEGKTWSGPTLCIPAPGYFVVNNDRVIQLRGGRLVMPAAYHRNKLPPVQDKEQMYAAFEERGLAMFFLSDDAGQTWREAKDWWAMPVRSQSGLQEPGVVELSDGRLYAHARTDLGCHYEMFSEDQGETWSAPRPSVFRSPWAPMSLKRIPSTGDLLAVWNDHSGRLAPVRPTKHAWVRNPLVAAISRDDGRTWSRGRLLEDDPERGFCYAAIHFVDDFVLFYYNWDLSIRRVSLDWLYASEKGK